MISIAISLILMLCQVTTPLACVPEFGHSDMEARNFWVGYDYGDGGFVLPVDDVPLARLKNGDAVIWVNYSPTTRLYYLFVFDHEPTAADPHPCGQGAVTEEQFQLIMGNDNG